MFCRSREICSVVVALLYIGHIYDFAQKLFSFSAVVIKKSYNKKLNTEKYCVNIRHLIYFQKRNMNHYRNQHFSHHC